MADDYTVEWHDHTAVFTLQRVARHNTLTLNVLEGLSQTLDTLEAGSGDGLIITGAGEKAFCAGTDLNEMQRFNQREKTRKTNFARELFFRIYNSPVTSVAAINGLAYGGGLELAMACTFRLAVAAARFSLPEVKLALLPCYGGTQYLPALVGRDRALEIMLTGRVLDAEEALRVGLISNIIAPEADLMKQAKTLSDSIHCYSQIAINGIKKAVAMSGHRVTEEGLEAERQATTSVSESWDAKEGVAAFLEKRPPEYKNR